MSNQLTRALSILCLFEVYLKPPENRRIDKIDGMTPHKSTFSNLYLLVYFYPFQHLSACTVYSVYLSIQSNLRAIFTIKTAKEIRL